MQLNQLFDFQLSESQFPTQNIVLHLYSILQISSNSVGVNVINSVETEKPWGQGEGGLLIKTSSLDAGFNIKRISTFPLYPAHSPGIHFILQLLQSWNKVGLDAGYKVYIQIYHLSLSHRISSTVARVLLVQTSEEQAPSSKN